MTDQARFRDFTKKRSPVFFTIGDDRFDCYKALNPVKLQEAITAWRAGGDKVEDIDEGNFVERIKGVLKFFLLPAAYTQLMVIIDDADNDDPIDIEQYTEIIQWLMEIYGGRPTQASSSSSSSSENDDAGTSSAAGPQLQELTLFDSTPVGSSTS